jgi:hypothetical protein
MAIEEPDFRTIERDGDYELREYAPYLLAETRVEASFMESSNVAFGRLFRYISGANTAQRKIAMTAPVEQAPAAGRGGEKIAMTAPVEQSPADAAGSYVVGFVVPSQYTRETVPQPTDPRVSIREVPARRVAVWRYSGRWTEENFREHEAKLRATLQQRRIAIAPGAAATIARYDAPFMPWFLRRNEVHLEVGGAR